MVCTKNQCKLNHLKKQKENNQGKPSQESFYYLTLCIKIITF